MWLLRLPRVARQFPSCAENGGSHFLRGGLAVAARNAHHRNGELLAPAIADALECRLRITDDDLRERDGLLAVDERASGAGGVCGGDELVAIEVRSAQGDEQGTPCFRACGCREETP